MSKHTLRQLIRLLLTTNFSNRRIAQLAATSPNTVRTYRQKLSEAAIDSADVAQLADNQLVAKLNKQKQPGSDKRQPDWPYIHQLMQAKHQTLIQLWEEYRSIRPADAFSYSQFTHYYRQYVKSDT